MTIVPALARLLNDPRLGLTQVKEAGTFFTSGHAVRFPFVRNTEKSPKMGARFGQDIEPTGRYLLHDTALSPELPRGWERGAVHFQAPLVLWFAPAGEWSYGPEDWKHRLTAITKKRRGRLSRFLRSIGIDAIVTVVKVRGELSTSEIVDLTQVR